MASGPAARSAFGPAAAARLVVLVLPFLIPAHGHAVPPPDFLFQVGSSVLRFFSLAFVAVLAVGAAFGRFWAVRRALWGKTSSFRWAGIVAGSALLAGVLAVGAYRPYRQKREFERWVERVETMDFVARLRLGAVEGDGTPRLSELRRRGRGERFRGPAGAQTVDPTTVQPPEWLIDPARLASSTGPAVLLDIREDLEWERGHIPGATHVRLADLLDGEWTALSRSAPIYLFCYEGARSRLAAGFLRSRGLQAWALEGGVRRWRSTDGAWTSGAPWPRIETRYRRFLSRKDVEAALAEGALLIDVRRPEKARGLPLPGAYPAQFFYTPRRELPAVWARIPAGRPFVIACDSTHSCHGGWLVAKTLVERGQPFIGIFGNAWELTDDPSAAPAGS